VNLRLELPAVDGLEVIGYYDHPRYGNHRLRPPFGSAGSRLVGDRWRVDVRVQKLQPKEEDYTGTFLVRAERSLEIDGMAKISADNLSEPTAVPVHLTFTVTERPISYYDAEELLGKLLR
jgi:hypothetical protein